MIRVLHCLNLLIPGGVERLRMSIFTRLPRDRFEHRVICTEILDDAYADRMRAVGVEIVAVGAVGSVLRPHRYRIAAREIDSWRPDIVHGAVIEGYTLASVVGRWKRAPVVIMEETSDPQNRRWKGHVLARTMAAFADLCVAVSPGVGRYLTETIHVPRSKVTVINNGVEQPTVPTSDALAALRAEYGIHDGDRVIGSVGRMADESHKCFGDLIRALALLRDLADVKLVLVGDGPERPGLERLASDLGVSDRVLFAGFQLDTGPFYALMDVFALASAREAFGLVNAEAMRCGLPVVATAVGGIPDVVLDGETGLLVPPRDTAALAAALRRVLNDDVLRHWLGAAGKVRADRLFSAERYVGDIEELYDRAVAQGGRRR